jgi:hypothetical protein
MEAIRSSETSVLTRTTRRNIPEDAILQNFKLSPSSWFLTDGNIWHGSGNPGLFCICRHICTAVSILTGWVIVMESGNEHRSRNFSWRCDCRGNEGQEAGRLSWWMRRKWRLIHEKIILTIVRLRPVPDSVSWELQHLCFKKQALVVATGYLDVNWIRTDRGLKWKIGSRCAYFLLKDLSVLELLHHCLS